MPFIHPVARILSQGWGVFKSLEKFCLHQRSPVGARAKRGGILPGPYSSTRPLLYQAVPHPYMYESSNRAHMMVRKWLGLSSTRLTRWGSDSIGRASCAQGPSSTFTDRVWRECSHCEWWGNYISNKKKCLLNKGQAHIWTITLEDLRALEAAEATVGKGAKGKGNGLPRRQEKVRL